ncbi:MAG: bifunctional folylpolyglutamate synthase/dihydrofolate synthase [Treponema sp.]|nr:bifunctional folylpolyglutamate synthase/dihydrofolate synthase [Treponema sp.]
MTQLSVITTFENWLNTYLNFEKTPKKDIFWLDTVQFICNKLHNPQNDYPSIHIAGSKGKGSVSTMISSILTQAGYHTGLYTSPHIMDFIERVGRAYGPFDEQVYKKAADIVMDSVTHTPLQDFPAERPITWFELITIFAFVCFSIAKVDYGVFEVGLGGRLDATNVLTPRLCILTPIELEHTQFLGDTLEKIATEKAGIIKQGVPVISAVQKASVSEVFLQTAQKHDAPISFITDLIQNMKYTYKESTTHTPKMQITLQSHIFNRTIHANMQLLGNVQMQNAALASCAVKTLLPDIDETCIEKGLEKASLPGRFEIITKNEIPTLTMPLILDGAHTLNSVRFTMETFNALYKQKKAHLLFACAADKDIEHIATLFKTRFDSIMITKPGNVKQTNLTRITNAFSNNQLSFTEQDDYTKAIPQAIKEAQNDAAVLLITGSFYLIAEVKKVLRDINSRDSL